MQIGEPTSLPSTVVLRLKKQKSSENKEYIYRGVATKGRESRNMKITHAPNAETTTTKLNLSTS